MADALTWSADTVVCADTSGTPEVNTLSQDNTLLTKKDSLLMSIMTKTRHSLSELLKHRATPYVMAATLALTPACTGVGENKDAVKAPSWTEPVSLLQSATASPAVTAPVAETTPVISEAPITTTAQPPAWAKGLSGRTARSVLAFSDFVRNTQAEQMKLPENERILPNETVDIEAVVPVTSDGRGMDQLVNTGSKLPKLSFEQVTGYKTLTPENYAQVVEKLFDTSDIDVWLTRSDGTPMSAQELQDYRDDMADAKDRWLAKPAEFAKAGKEATNAKWFELFNEFNEKIIYPSRESSRRELMATNSMAVAMEKYPTLSDEQLKNFDPKKATEREKDLAGIYTTQMAELALMVDPEGRMVKITRQNTVTGNSLKYMIASDEALWKVLHFPGGVQTAQVGMNGWYEGQVKKYADYAEIVTTKRHIAAGESKIAAIDGYNSLSDKMGLLSDSIMAQLKEFPAKRTDPDYIKALNKDLQTYKDLRQQLAVIEKEDEQKHLINKEGIAVLDSLYTEVTQFAKAHNDPDSPLLKI